MTISFEPEFLSLIIHDLKNALNVIGLTMRLLEATAGKADPNVRDDLTMLNDNIGQIDRMLTRLSDYSHLRSGGDHPPAEFDPRRLGDELVEKYRACARNGSTLRLDVADDCPAVVELDPGRARMAIGSALENALGSAEGGPVRLGLRGGPDRLVVEVAIDRPPRETVRPTALRPDTCERLVGNPMERVSLELALAAFVSERFGGSARLDVEDGKGSTIVLDWPARLVQR